MVVSGGFQGIQGKREMGRVLIAWLHVERFGR